MFLVGLRDLSRVRKILQGHWSLLGWRSSREPVIGHKLDFFKAVNPGSFMRQIVTQHG
jgi:hypothetical protein